MGCAARIECLAEAALLLRMHVLRVSYRLSLRHSRNRRFHVTKLITNSIPLSFHTSLNSFGSFAARFPVCFFRPARYAIALKSFSSPRAMNFSRQAIFESTFRHSGPDCSNSSLCRSSRTAGRCLTNWLVKYARYPPARNSSGPSRTPCQARKPKIIPSTSHKPFIPCSLLPIPCSSQVCRLNHRLRYTGSICSQLANSPSRAPNVANPPTASPSCVLSTARNPALPCPGHGSVRRSKGCQKK